MFDMWLEKVRRIRPSTPIVWTLRVMVVAYGLVVLWLPARAVLDQNVPFEQVLLPSIIAAAGLLLAGVSWGWAARFTGVLGQWQNSRFQGQGEEDMSVRSMTTVFTLAIGFVMLSFGLFYGILGYLCMSVDRLTGSTRVRLIYTANGVITVVCILVGLTFIAWVGSWVYFRNRIA